MTLFLDGELPAEQVHRLEAHIDGCAGCRRVVSELAKARTPATDRIDRYVVLRELGAGGMGLVFAAYDPLLDRKVALKLLRNSEAGVRLVREAQALARVTSPHVVTVYDAGVMEDEVYIAMELVEGGTLRAWLDQPRSWREVIGVFEQAGRGLAAAHAGGIVHRDFKPENVLLDRERVRVADFGLAIADGHDAPSGGTPAYMAPEHLAGEGADARSDQFSYCVAFYEALYGERPFAGATMRELLSEIRGGHLRPPARRVPAWLRAIVVRGLEADPAARFPELGALLDQLARRRVRIRRALFASAALAIAATSGGLAIAATGGEAADPCGAIEVPAYDAAAVRAGLGGEGGLAVARLDAWRARVVDLRGRACRAANVDATESAELLDLRMACLARSVDRVQALAAELAKPSRALADTALASIEAAIAVDGCTAPRPLLDHARVPADPIARAAVERAGRRLAEGQAANAAGRYAEAARLAAEVARAAPTRALAAEAYQLQAQALDNDRDHDAARAAFEQALIAAEASGHEVVQVSVYLWLAIVENRHDRRGDAARWIAQARALVERTGLTAFAPSVRYHEGLLEIWRDNSAGAIAAIEEAVAAQVKIAPESEAMSRMLGSLAHASWQTGRTEAASGHATRAVAIGERALGPRHPVLLQPLFLLASFALVGGDPAGAIALGRRQYEIARAHAGPDGALLVQSAAILAISLSEAGQQDEALALLGRALADYARTNNADTTHYAHLLNLRAHALTNARRFAEALADQDRALAIIRARLGDRSLELAAGLEGRGRILLELDRPADSIEAYAAALALRATTQDPGSRYYAELGLGLGYHAARDPVRAIPHLERAIALRLDTPDADPSELANARFGLARVLVERGDRARATELLRAARATYAAISDEPKLREIDALLRGN